MALMTPPRGVRPGEYLLVVHDFDARGTDELTLRRGEKIELVELDDGFGDGWYLGRDIKTGTTGLFPGVYTTAIPKIPVQKSSDTIKSGGSVSQETDLENGPAEARAPVASPKSGESTPQASRHVSASDIQVPDIQSSPVMASPKRSSSSPLPNTTLDIQNSLRQSIDSHLNVNGQDSPVMNETLSVIDEHITDLSTPRHSVAPPQESKNGNDSASEYSSHLDHRMSYINGHETDEEEENQPTEEEVRGWDHVETAKRMRELGVEAKHCDIFEEQEITGDVVLDMDQEFLFMKEFDFGVMGRRLKTWHKIKAFQEEVRTPRSSPRGSTGYSGPEERSLSRAGHTGPFLPRIPGYSDKSASYHQSRNSGAPVQHPRLVSSIQSNTSSPMTSHGSYGISTRRPSAASIRDINHSRRHSSIDATQNRLSGVSDSSFTFHQKKPSFDRGWTMASGAQQLPSRPGTSLGTPTESLLPQHIFRGADGSDSAISVSERYDDLDRGYFSGPEGDTRKNRRTLQKRGSITGSVGHSRKSSYTDDPVQLTMNKRHSRIASIDSIRDAANRASPAVKAFTSPPPSKGRFRSLSTRISDRSAQRTNLSNGAEGKGNTNSGFFASFTPFSKSEKVDPESSGRSSPMPAQQPKNTKQKIRRGMGFRAMSDVIGKGVDTSVPPASPVKEIDPSSIRTGSTTPSATSKSSERHSTDGSAKATEGGISFPRPRASVKAGVKSKKDTSAYTQGLEKKTPEEQMDGCEFSGWMKKKSSNLMTTWKPRLFVLRGRRLSYYYSENDPEERGLIDITAHRVLRADNDPIIALHATITGATASPTSPANSQNPELTSSAKTSSESTRAPKKDGDGPFFFKLVPPKTTRTVQFTKPAIHYFQVDNIAQGRLWMAALMKATIDRDMDMPVESTNKQKTISLKQARLMNQRPPALMSTPTTQEDNEAEAAAEEEDKRASAAQSSSEESQNGLLIQGVGLDKESAGNEDVNNELPSSNPLGGLDTGPSSLLPENLAETSR